MCVAPRARISGDLLVGGALVLLAALLFAPAFVAAGSEFDEGVAVAFPTRVLQGDLPYRDFETFYGPGGPFLVAAVFRLFGSTLGAERATSLCFRLLVVVALYWLLRPWGEATAFAGGILAASVVAAGGLVFDSELAAQAFGLVALALTWRSVRRSDAPFVLAALAAGLATLFRPDVGAITLVAMAPLVVVARVRARSLLLASAVFVAAVGPYLPLALAAGTNRLGRNFHDLVATGRARRLPITADSDAGRLLVGVVLALALVVAVAALGRRRRSPRAPLLLAIALFGALQVPYALWRADPRHVGIAGLLALAALPAAAVELAPQRARRATCAAATLAVLALFTAVHDVRGGISRNVKLALGRTHSHVVSHAGRDFRLDDARAARELQRAVDAVGRRERPGARLFVGPTDLRRTDANDVFVYYLLPDLRPASFYLELDPPASKPDSGLARDVARADVLVLGRRWNRASEPNASRGFGSSRPNRVLRRLFCRRAAFGGYEVLTRCRPGRIG
jgi:hypothetical protein